MNKKTITYKGKSFTTKHFGKELSYDEFYELKNRFYEKPSLKEVREEISKLFTKDRVMTTKIKKFFFFDLMTKVRHYEKNWTLEEVWNNKELIEYYYTKTFKSKKVYGSNDTLENLKTQFRIGSSSVTKTPTNYPLKSVKEILNRYNINNNYYDFSCGWGIRMLGSLVRGINYFGTDPNYILIERLKHLYDITKEEVLKLGSDIQKIDIRDIGSEVFVPEWENKIGVQFSSPPYYLLEEYVTGKQSQTLETTYDEWKNNYLYPTLDNIKRYLIDDGILLINITDYLKYSLVKDSYDYIISIGLEPLGTMKLKNIKRPNMISGKFIDNSEDIMIFKKKKINEPIQEIIIPIWEK